MKLGHSAALLAVTLVAGCATSRQTVTPTVTLPPGHRLHRTLEKEWLYHMRAAFSMKGKVKEAMDEYRLAVQDTANPIPSNPMVEIYWGLLQIDQAKQQIEMANRLKRGAVVSKEEIDRYLKGGLDAIPNPADGEFVINPAGIVPVYRFPDGREESIRRH